MIRFGRPRLLRTAVIRKQYNELNVMCEGCLEAPNSVEEVFSINQGDEWKAAMEEEYSASCEMRHGHLLTYHMVKKKRLNVRSMATFSSQGLLSDMLIFVWSSH